MDFAEAWDALSIGDGVAVSDGTPPPSANVDGFPYKCWKSHNFTGTLVARNDGPPRTLTIDLDADGDGTVIGYSVMEGIAHIFTAVAGGE